MDRAIPALEMALAQEFLEFRAATQRRQVQLDANPCVVSKTPGNRLTQQGQGSLRQRRAPSQLLQPGSALDRGQAAGCPRQPDKGRGPTRILSHDNGGEPG